MDNFTAEQACALIVIARDNRGYDAYTDEQLYKQLVKFVVDNFVPEAGSLWVSEEKGLEIMEVVPSALGREMLLVEIWETQIPSERRRRILQVDDLLGKYEIQPDQVGGA